ncbi:hypothetical protein RCH18_000662 [Flavobacterium sp. PL11]|jgi:hypothetical protein|uniref:hypothetical protein n=1 Tax=Flavobacterium sp. PL11 TaxID=3071717 RepID=UPI002E04E1E4|nr:hypothetical protein [Flavobacterium sp. PL11]
MRKKTYPQKKETLSIVTPPNETYNGKVIALVVATTAGEFDQSGKLLKISNSKGKKT